MIRISNYINGEYRDFAERVTVNNPATGAVIATCPKSDKECILSAVSAARQAFKTWKKVSRIHKSELFDNLAQLIKLNSTKLQQIISLETGKSLNESLAEVNETLHMIQYVVGTGRQAHGVVSSSEIESKESYVVRKPKGVVAVISPWNFPLAIGSSWTSAPAIMEGNTVVHKPSELTPLIADTMCDLYHQAGFPRGVYNIVHGDGQTGAFLVESDVDVILFTGSAEVGKLIRQHCASTWNKTCSIECGSKSAVMVFEDGNINLALQATVASSFKLTGQRCVSASRILVQRSIMKEFTDKFLTIVKGLKFGDPQSYPAPDFGPVISAKQKDRVLQFNHMVLSDKDATVLYASDDVPNEGYYLAPFVYTCEWADKLYLKQEVFGPHVAIIPFDTIEDAIRIYNDTEYGLALGAITNDFKKHRMLKEECDTGMLYINGGSIAAESHNPFGGVKKSGNGHKSASGTYRAVTEEVAVTINYDDNLQFPQGMK